MPPPELVTGRGRVTLGELQAAYAAACRGAFGDVASGGTRPGAPESGDSRGRDGSDQYGARHPMPDDPRPDAASAVTPDAGTRVVAVLAGHPGAGASTVAVAIADDLGARGFPTALVDTTDTTRSGIVTAATDELGVDGAGWRCARRGPVQIYRPDRSITDLAALPTPVIAAGHPSYLIIDLTRDGPGWLLSAAHAAHPVVVCRVTVPGIRRTENVVAALAQNRSLTIAAVGSARWPGAVTASCGPAVRAVRRAGRIVAIPINRRLLIDGVTPAPLPRHLTAATARLVTRLLLDPAAPDADPPAGKDRPTSC